ncbi:hypothetical protein FI667_g777, partial [Globisporangium splendens]
MCSKIGRDVPVADDLLLHGVPQRVELVQREVDHARDALRATRQERVGHRRRRVDDLLGLLLRVGGEALVLGLVPLVQLCEQHNGAHGRVARQRELLRAADAIATGGAMRFPTGAAASSYMEWNSSVHRPKSL